MFRTLLGHNNTFVNDLFENMHQHIVKSCLCLKTCLILVKLDNNKNESFTGLNLFF